MKCSKFMQVIKINKDVYAVFNNLLLQPIFLNKKNIINLKLKRFSKFNKNEFKILKQNGIIVKDDYADIKALKKIKTTINSNIKNKITLMYIIPNNNCNLMCKYCFIGKLNNKNPKKMSSDTMKNAVDKFASHLKEIKAEKGEIVFYGGEPLISFDLIKECVEYSKTKKYNFKYSIVSNATLITEEIADYIRDNNIGIGISIDGPKEVTDKNRIFEKDLASVYDIVIKKIDLLISRKVDFGLSITIAEEFLDSQDQFIEWLKKLDIKGISYNLLHYTSKTKGWKKYYKRATKFLIKSNNELYNLGFREDRIKRKYYAFYERDFKYSDCGARGGNQVSVKRNGDITICLGYWNSPENEIGNINKINISDVFKKDNYKKWYINTPINNDICQKCDALFLCGGGCAMQSKALFGDEMKIDKAFCIHSKIVLKFLLTELYYEEISKIAKN